MLNGIARAGSAGRRGDVIGVLDIGTSKTVCLVAAPEGSRAGGRRRRVGACVLGFGHRPSRGLKAGVVIDLDGAEQALHGAVTQAEQMAGETIEDVFVAVACGRLKSTTFEAETGIEGRVVGEADTDRLLAAGRRYAERDGHALVHLNHVAYRVDGAGAAPDPCGIAGTVLAADLHAVTVEDAPLRNLLHVVERADLFAAGIVPAPWASGLGATTEEERRLGATCIDIGAGTTTVSMFADGRLLSVAAVAIGGHHVTFDIARALSVPFGEAERIKTAYATLERGSSDDDEMVADDLSGERRSVLYDTTRADLYEVVAVRIGDLLGQVAERIERSGVAHLAAHRIVLTGGSSLLPGLAEFSEEVLAGPVRIGRPRPMPGMPAFCSSPQFSTAFGLVRIALDAPAEARRGRSGGAGAGYLHRVGQWLREGF